MLFTRVNYMFLGHGLSLERVEHKYTHTDTETHVRRFGSPETENRMEVLPLDTTKMPHVAQGGKREAMTHRCFCLSCLSLSLSLLHSSEFHQVCAHLLSL